MQLVFLHALPFDGRMWDHTATSVELPRLAPDLYRFGSHLEDWADAVLDLCGKEPIIAVGCSVGGSCALELAARAPDRIAGLILVGTKAGVRPQPDLRDEAVRLLETEGVDVAWQRYWEPLFGPDTPAATIDTGRRWAQDQGAAALADGVRAFHDRRGRDDLAARLTVPIIGVSGEHDTSPPPEVMRRIATGPERRFHEVADAGHYVNLEQPEVFDRLVDHAVSHLLGAPPG